MDFLKINPGLTIWTWVSFGILFLLMSRFVFPSLIKSMNERAKTLAKALDNASQVEKRLSEIHLERENTLAKANAEAQEILQTSRKEAQALREELVNKAKSEASEILEQAKKDAEEEKRKILKSLNDELADLVCDSAEALVGQTFLKDQDREWTKKLVSGL